MSDKEIAARAFAAWEKGESSGDYDDFKLLLGAAEFEIFSHPLAPARGTFRGSDALAKMRELIAGREKTPNALRFSNVSIAAGEEVFVFQFDSEGTVAGGFVYRGWNAIALTIKNGKIVGFREYVGDLDPAWFGA